MTQHPDSGNGVDAPAMLPPGATIGVVGGGQLARMLLPAGLKLGYRLAVLDAAQTAPAAANAHVYISGDPRDPHAVRRLAQTADLVTIELENVSVEGLTAVRNAGLRVYPEPELLAAVQDKAAQRDLLARLGFPVPEWCVCDLPTADELTAFGFPLVQKLRRGGYDGRGVAVIHEPAQMASRQLQGPSILERCVPMERELAIVVARGRDGTVVSYPPAISEMDPERHVLDLLAAPPQITDAAAQRARELAEELIAALEHVGLLAVEMFVDTEGELWLNEISPRPHNSGHHTIEAASVSQFELHLRAITGLPLFAPAMRAAAAVANLLAGPGEGPPNVTGWSQALAEPDVHVHWYDKRWARPGRKMGHVTVLRATLAEACAVARDVRRRLHVAAAETAPNQ